MFKASSQNALLVSQDDPELWVQREIRGFRRTADWGHEGRYNFLQATKPRNFPHPFHEKTAKKGTVDRQKFEIGFKMEEKCF